MTRIHLHYVVWVKLITHTTDIIIPIYKYYPVSSRTVFSKLFSTPLRWVGNLTGLDRATSNRLSVLHVIELKHLKNEWRKCRAYTKKSNQKIQTDVMSGNISLSTKNMLTTVKSRWLTAMPWIQFYNHEVLD